MTIDPEEITAQLAEIIEHLTLYHYAAFVLVVLLFLFFVVLAILFWRKMGLMLMMLLLAIITLFAGPVAAYVGIERIVRATEVSQIRTQQLYYSDDIFVMGVITNQGLVDYKECKITAFLYKQKKEVWRNFLSRLKPLKKGSTTLNKPLRKGESVPFRFAIHNIRLSEKPGVDITTRCR